MSITIKKCLAVIGVGAVLAIYGAGVYKNEMTRQTPYVAKCSIGHCVPNDATFSALR